MFLQRVRDAVAAGRLAGPVIVVVEGVARRGVDEGVAGGVEVVHAPGSGDDSLVALAGTGVTAVTADRELRRRLVAAGAATVGPRWLLDRIE